MKILVISPVYSLAGVPLAQFRLAKSLSDIGHNVDLIYGCKKNKFQEKSKNMNVIFFNKFRVIGMLFPLIKYLLLNKPKIIFSAEDHLNAIVVIAKILSFSKAKLTVSSRVTPIDTYRNSHILFSKGWFLKKLFPLVNSNADVMTCVSRDMIKQYRKIFRYTKQVCVYNIVKNKDSTKKMKEKVKHPWIKNKNHQLIVASGKLAEWKGFDVLIRSIKILEEKKLNLKFKLLIIGGGPEEYNLNKLIVKFKLTKKIQILKPITNTLKYFSKSDIFVLSSRVEGMPNVMIEAMMCGCTVVATDCPTGPREIIKQNQYGYLSKLNNPKDLAKNIHKALKKKVSSKKTNKIINNFSALEIIKKHFLLLKFEKDKWIFNL